MSRVPFQVLVLPFRRSDHGAFEYAALRRDDSGSWQGVAGGGEAGEAAAAAARREAEEEAGIPGGAPFYRLDSMASIPAYHFAARKYWSAEVFVVPEYAFAVDCTLIELRLSHEHTEMVWGDCVRIAALFRYDSNRTALWELDQRLRLGRLEGAPP